jgi:hypothetical protein
MYPPTGSVLFSSYDDEKIAVWKEKLTLLLPLDAQWPLAQPDAVLSCVSVPSSGNLSQHGSISLPPPAPCDVRTTVYSGVKLEVVVFLSKTVILLCYASWE